MEEASPSKSSVNTEAGDNSSSSDAESWIVLDQDDVPKEEVKMRILGSKCAHFKQNVCFKDFDDGRTPELSSSDMAYSGATVGDLNIGGDQDEEPQEATKKAEHEGLEPCKILKICLPFSAYFYAAFCFWGLWSAFD